MSLAKQVGQGAFWQLLGGGWTTLVRFVASIFLARALTPNDFGVFGIAMLLNTFVLNVGHLGLGAGVIAKREVTKLDLSTCFWIIAFVRMIAFVIVFLSSGLLGGFFDSKESVDVIKLISFVFIISIVGSVPQIKLSKELKFYSINIIRAISVFLESLTAVILAVMTDFGYWSLVCGVFVYAIFFNSMILYLSGWVPAFYFDKQSFRYLMRYGLNGLGFSIANYLSQNLDYIIVGRLLGSKALGLYEFSYRLPHLVDDRISKPIGAVLFPALSKAQDDNNAISSGYFKYIKYLSLITFPVLFGLASVAELAVGVLWGEQWQSIVIPLQILCLCVVLRVMTQQVGAIFKTKNRPDLPFKMSIVNLMCAVVFISILGHFFGLNGVAVGMVISLFPNFVFVLLALKMINSNFLMYFREFLPSFVCSFLCASVSFFISSNYFGFDISLFMLLVISIVFGAMVYFVSLYVLFRKTFKASFDCLRLSLPCG